MRTIIAKQRAKYHKDLLSLGVLSLDTNGIPSNADRASKLSVQISKGIANRLSANTKTKALGQTAGAQFEQLNMEFLKCTFPLLQNIRPGSWHIMKLGNRNAIKASSFSQYEHLDYLAELTKQNAKLASIVGNDYMVSPDVVIYRDALEDSEINQEKTFVDDSVARMTDIRKKFNPSPILHASISAKWTMRSDRAQNSRTEALGLIRNRKGRLPHIVVVTGEPMPSRIASLAMGTGDIDCVYHFALYELIEAVKGTDDETSIELLNTLINGKRLKDISDLPLDLAI